MADPNQQPSIGARITFSVVGTLLFLVIATLPGVLMGWWYWDATRTHLVTMPVIVVLLGALWAVATFMGPGTRAGHSG